MITPSLRDSYDPRNLVEAIYMNNKAVVTFLCLCMLHILVGCSLAVDTTNTISPSKLETDIIPYRTAYEGKVYPLSRHNFQKLSVKSSFSLSINIYMIRFLSQ